MMMDDGLMVHLTVDFEIKNAAMLSMQITG
jgi:hypothetical protein